MTLSLKVTILSLSTGEKNNRNLKVFDDLLIDNPHTALQLSRCAAYMYPHSIPLSKGMIDELVDMVLYFIAGEFNTRWSSLV